MKYSLPASANDLLIKDGKLLMRSLSVYEILRRFGPILRLTAFRFEDFTAALLAEDQSALLSEIHIQLLKTLLREDRQQQTWLGPPDIRDSVNLYLHLIDHSNWPAALRIYLSADTYNNSDLLDLLEEIDNEARCYPFSADLVTKITVLEQLCDQFLLSVLAREEIVNGSNSAGRRDPACRLCAKPTGDLITCDSCLANVHLKCSEPTLDTPSAEDDKPFVCTTCRNNFVKGVSDCISDEEKAGNLKRHEALGLDKQGRRYWFVARRLFVVDETEDDVRYYTTISQLQELLETLIENRYDKSLIENLTTQKEEMERQMLITEDLYNTLMKEHKKNDGTYTLNLGQDGAYRCYTNNYPPNAIASGKLQPYDRDMIRSLNNKFCMTMISSFKWFGAIDGHINTITLTVRTTILKFETQLPQTFTHPCWQQVRSEWMKSMGPTQKPYDFAKALTKLETCIKPVLFKAAWYDSVGFMHLFRSTYLEREELKKIDRQPRGFERNERTTADFELSQRLGTMVKFSPKLKPVKHQVWKQKGEEYRLTGLNGWYWQGITRRSRLRSIPKLYRIELPQGERTLTVDTLQKRLKDKQEPSIKNLQPKLPPTHDFMTRRGKVRSIFVLPRLELHKLARSGGMREARTFSYTAKQNQYIWPYGVTPRPTFRTCWLYRNECIDTIQDVSLQLKVLYACLRWDDLQSRPPVTGNNVIVTDESTITIELLKKRDKLPYLLHSEYLIKKTTRPNEQSTPKPKKAGPLNTSLSARSGLRARRQVATEEEKKPEQVEVWVSEYELELWELRHFDEKIERQKVLMRERALREERDKRRRLEEQKQRTAETERRRAKAEQDEVNKRLRMSAPVITYQKVATPTNAVPNINNSDNTTANQQSYQKQGAQTAPTTPVLRYFRTEQGQIIRLPASYLQRGTPLILRHVSPGTNQTNTYIIRPQAATVTASPMSTTNNVALRLVAPTTPMTTALRQPTPQTPLGTPIPPAPSTLREAQAESPLSQAPPLQPQNSREEGKVKEEEKSEQIEKKKEVESAEGDVQEKQGQPKHESEEKPMQQGRPDKQEEEEEEPEKRDDKATAESTMVASEAEVKSNENALESKSGDDNGKCGGGGNENENEKADQLREPAMSVGTVANELAHDQHAPTTAAPPSPVQQDQVEGGPGGAAAAAE